MDYTMDYSKPLSQTYLEFAVAVATKNCSLDVICAAEPIVRDGLTFPSWCPDWSTPSKISSITRQDQLPVTVMRGVCHIGGPIYNAAGSEDLVPRFSFDGPVLECAGVVLDSVRIIAPYEGFYSGVKEQKIWYEWLKIAVKELLPEQEMDLAGRYRRLQSAFWSLLAGDATILQADRAIPEHRNAAQIEKSQDKEWQQQLSGTDASQRAITTRGRRLIITEEGRMGLAPYYVEKGGKLAILSGCSSPVLLHENSDGTYRFVGSCFVQGWMKGEMLEQFGETEEEAWEAIDERGRLRIL